jgi:hypothetical protein
LGDEHAQAAGAYAGGETGVKHILLMTVFLVALILVVIYGLEPALRAPTKAAPGNAISALLIVGF